MSLGETKDVDEVGQQVKNSALRLWLSRHPEHRFELKTIPILQSNDTFIVDSWLIAEWLDRTYPDHPATFQSQSDIAMIRFFDKWFSTAVSSRMLRACIGALHDTLRLEDRGYFKTTREQRLGETFEAMAPKIADNIGAMRAALLPIRLTLQEQPFIGGEEPNYADFIGFAALISFGSVSRSMLRSVAFLA
jgi:glutathione S-transferase